jgi:hypothetical protein
MRALNPTTPSPGVAGLPTYCDLPSCRSTSNHVMSPLIALSTTTASMVIFRLHPKVGGSPAHPAESSSLSCGPTVRFRLLPTPPHDDAVTFSYGAVAYSGMDLHHANKSPSWAHIGVGKGEAPSPPSEPCMRFSRTRLSSWWFPHRDWRARTKAAYMVKSPRSAKKAFGHCL